MSSSEKTTDYKETVFLPKTSFPMKGNLPTLEPQILREWINQDIYKRIREKAQGKPLYVLHDGPPYANGNMHLGHALNKILKDVILKFYTMSGYNTPFVPGWDCHGLPIEWKIEEQYRAQKKNKDDVSILEFRKECRAFADKWIEIQKEELQRLGVFADWNHPYVTMTYDAEASIVKEILSFLEKGFLYRGSKPVMWSVVEKTALAEAEVEYHEHTSPSIYVGFSVVSAKDPNLVNASAVIWTTTPWTLPGNRAIAYNPDIEYVLLEETQTKRRFIIAEALCEDFLNAVEISGKIVKKFPGSDLEGVISRHPFYGKGYDYEVPLLPAHHVTVDQGTGLVHTAPGHGEDDFLLGRAFNLEIPEIVGPDGTYYQHVPLFSGDHVFKVNPKVITLLKEQEALLCEKTIRHSYPHSWRSKAPLIYRTTPQWFLSLNHDNLRQKALEAIENVRWIPEMGKNRIGSMVENRPDWCLSRQRYWGVPLTLFMEIKTGKPLYDARVNARILEAIEKNGGDAWYQGSPKRFLEGLYNPEDYEPVLDCVDVWFDSGCTYAYVLQKRSDLHFPADLYLEGSDQHRGWFQSSLIESVGMTGVAPYKTVLTHGFLLDEKGYKMSKSMGNTVVPQKIIDEMGADILRLWVINSDYTEDLRIGPGILKYQQEIYRRFRNTLRYLLGALHGFSEEEEVAYGLLPPLEKYILHKVSVLNNLAQTTLKTFDFHRFYTELHNFVAGDLSAFYFDLRKDILYCDPSLSHRRRSVRTVMNILLDHFVLWLAPVLSFTAEEAFKSRYGDDSESIHLQEFLEVPKDWHNSELALTWENLRSIRRVLLGALELERAKGTLGSSLESKLVLYCTYEVAPNLKDVDLPEFAIVSEVSLVEGFIPESTFQLPDVSGVGVHVLLAEGKKCSRCWKILSEVGNILNHPELCHRCVDAVDVLKEERESNNGIS